MKDLRLKDKPLYYLLGPQIEWLFYNYWRPKQLPNDLTRLRMLLIPFQLGSLLAGIITGTDQLVFASLLILSFQGLSDWMDGYIAYHYDCATPEGAQLDPRADKLVVLPNLMIFPIWSFKPSMPVSSITLLLCVLLADGLDAESDVWYRYNLGGKSNFYGKLKFGIQILVAAIGIGTMLVHPDLVVVSKINLLCAFLMMGANFCARISLNLKQRGLPKKQEAEEFDYTSALVQSLLHPNQTSID